MLKQIVIRDYAVVAGLELELAGGMTVITGETGAGKSIMLDALGLCVGDRADSRAVRPGADKADVTALFSIDALPEVQTWLEDRELSTGNQECLLRRVIGSDGRSRAFINGTPATLADCGELGALLVDIHSQHAHQSLLRRGTQRQLLDTMAGAQTLAEEVADAARTWGALTAEFVQKANQSEADSARFDLLNYQVNELDALNLGPNELVELEREQKQLSNADFLIETAGQAVAGCEDQAEQIARLRGLLTDERHTGKSVVNVLEMLETAAIQLEEAGRELSSYGSGLERDPERLSEVSQRLDNIYSLARKHRVMPEQLPAHHEALAAELASLDAGSDRLEKLQKQIDSALDSYQNKANKLSKLRRKAAKKLSTSVTETLAQLAMERCEFDICLTPQDAAPHSHGAEQIEFRISTQPGSPAGALSRIASGGELSRISLALQVAAASRATAPTMIFDEVDVGIGGAVAEVVGSLLQKLSADVQVLCVTHLPQVACKGGTHLRVAKSGDATSVYTDVHGLQRDERVEEIARMLGGVTISDTTRAHARDMLGV